MEINELSKRIAEDIREAKKTRVRGYVAYAIKSNAYDISALLNTSYYRIPDLYGTVSAELGEKPCVLKSFRDLCNKYCKDKSAVPEKKVASKIRASENHSSLNEPVETPLEDEGDDRENLESFGLDDLGDEWQEIIESLGPAKKQQLPLAIDRGLTLEEAKKARQVSTKELKNVLTNYGRRKR